MTSAKHLQSLMRRSRLTLCEHRTFGTGLFNGSMPVAADDLLRPKMAGLSKNELEEHILRGGMSGWNANILKRMPVCGIPE